MIELSQGWEGELIKDQTAFVVLEGVSLTYLLDIRLHFFVVDTDDLIAVYALHIGHPSFLTSTLTTKGLTS